jgi:hypothetical protein
MQRAGSASRFACGVEVGPTALTHTLEAQRSFGGHWLSSLQLWTCPAAGRATEPRAIAARPPAKATKSPRRERAAAIVRAT